jgi:ribosomal protein S18 acetylase RimI-like enzyme/2'-5' RNA ligase
MIGLISLLTDEAYLQVERAKHWLEEQHGFSNPGYARPHVTYVISEGSGAPPGLIERIEALAEETDPFQIRLSGLGLFPEEEPVLYLPVQPSTELAAVQQAACRAFAESGEAIRPYYRSESWIPHVTLARGMVTPEKMDAVCAELPAEGTDLAVRLAGLALADEDSEGNWAITREFPFRGLNELPPNPCGLRSRPCQPSDRDFVYRLVEETLRPLVSAYFEWDQALFDQNWRGSWRQKVMVLAEGRRVGYIQYHPTPAGYLYIGGLFLVPAAQGQGWGKWLLGYMEGRADGRPVRLHVWENNPAVAFYQKYGYRIVETEGHKHLMEKRER